MTNITVVNIFNAVDIDTSTDIAENNTEDKGGGNSEQDTT